MTWRPIETINRRVLLRGAAVGMAAAAANPRWAAAQVLGAEAPFTDYRALVCVFLLGGNDSFNLLVPRSPAEYAAYAASRQNLAVAHADLLPVTPIDSGGLQYGLHPSVPEMRDLFESGRAAFITNIGPLIEPTTKESYLAGSVAVPPQLFAHNDQQDQWNCLNGASGQTSGWAGRMADLMRQNVANQKFAMNVSLYGNSRFQVGDETAPYAMGMSGPIPMYSFVDSLPLSHKEAFARVLANGSESAFGRAFADVQRSAIAAAGALLPELAAAPPLATVFPTTPLGRQLETVARLIAVRERFGMQRQIFFVGTGGFDTHDAQLANQGELLGNLSACLAAFHAATVELGIAHAVTTFTQSEFARTLTSNGDGTDHAWGGVQIVVGDSVGGRRLYGTYPVLELDGTDDIGGGRLIPSLAADQYAATLAKWFGIPSDELDRVAPNLANFAVRDLGFMT